MTFRNRLAEQRIVLAPGVYDAFSALLVEQAGFEAMYLSGASIAYTRLGRSDIGLVTASEVENTLANIRERTALPIVVDADTGFGNALNVMRTVKTFERAGATLIQLEDQTLPKRCGHLDGKMLVSQAEMVGKIKAALDARTSRDTLIMARTDAIAVEGFDRALDRAEAYVAAGADVLFVEAPPTVDHMKQALARFSARIPMLANMVEGGKTPQLPSSELGAMGYRIAIFPGGTVRALSFALQGYLASLKATGTTQPYWDRMLDFKQLNDLLGTTELLDLGKKYDG